MAGQMQRPTSAWLGGHVMFVFEEKAKTSQIESRLRRICDLTSPNFPRLDDLRCEQRQNRTIPVLISPWEKGVPVVAETTTALTRDISERGISVTLPHPFRTKEIVVGFWLSEKHQNDPWFFLGITRQNVPIGGGFWGLGIELVEQLCVSSEPAIERLVSLARDHLPPRLNERHPASALLDR
jgi:hypothetical protein